MSKAGADNRSFSSILEEKLGHTHDTHNSSTDSVIKSDFISAFPSENYNFVFSAPPALPPPRAHLSSYFKKNTKKRVQKPLTKSSLNEVIFSIENLSVVAQLAIVQLGAQTEAEGRYIKISAIKRAYRARAREHHPDLNPSKTGQGFNEYRGLSQLVLGELQALETSLKQKQAA